MTITIQHLRGLTHQDAAVVEPVLAELIGDRSLTGSAKQVAWASDIRRAALIDVAKTTCSSIRDYDHLPAGWEQYAASLERMLSRTEATWWIDHRASGMAMLRDAQR